MQGAVFTFRLTARSTPVVTRKLRNRDEPDRTSRIGAVAALPEDVKSRGPSRGEVVQAIGAACGRALIREGVNVRYVDRRRGRRDPASAPTEASRNQSEI